MREYPYRISKALTAGLRATERNKRNKQALVLSDGAYPEDGALVAPELLDSIDFSGLDPQPEFPFPQIIELINLTLVFTEDTIYEYDEDGPTLTERITGLDVGHIWSVADYGTYLIMVNGATVVFLQPDTNEFSIIDELGIVSATSVCNLNGQVIITAPQSII